MKRLTLITLCAFLLLSSCATITGGTKAKIKVLTYPTNSVYLNGSKIREGSGKVKIKGKALNMSIITVKDSTGVEVTKMNTIRKAKGGMIFLNIITTGGLGLIVDFVTGGIYKPVQKTFNAQ
jgi:hypothetical protein